MGKWLEGLSKIRKPARKAPAEPAKDGFDPFAGAPREEVPIRATASGAVDEQSIFHSTYSDEPAKPAKAPFDLFAGASRQELSKATASPEPEPPQRACTHCGSPLWWWDGCGAWYCNHCLADEHGQGGHTTRERRLPLLCIERE